MGAGRVVTCNNCSFKRDIYIGKGMSFFDGFDVFLEYSPNIISESELKRMNTVRSRRSKIDFSRELYHCHKCNNLSSELYVEFTYAETKKFIINHLCPKCETSMDVIDVKDIENKPCPICGKNLHLTDDFFLWD